MSTLAHKLQSYIAVGILLKGRQHVSKASGVHVNTLDRVINGKAVNITTLHKIELGLRKLNYGQDALPNK